MKRNWELDELIEHFTFLPNEKQQVGNKSGETRLGFAVLFMTWLKKQGIDDALIQPFSGHESRKSLEIYSKLAITDAQQEYNEVINKYPI